MLTNVLDTIGAALIVIAVFAGLGVPLGLGAAGVAVLAASWNFSSKGRR